MNPTKTYLYRYYEDEMHALSKNIRRLHENFAAENIHRLRITLKKIRAIYQLLELLSGGKFNAKKRYAVFNKLFKHAGKVREFQVNMLIVHRYKLSSHILKLYLQTADNKLKSYYSVLSEYLDSHGGHRLLRKMQKGAELCKKIDRHELIRFTTVFIQNEQMRVSQLYTKADKIANIHKIRTHLKRLGPVLKLYYGINPSPGMKKNIDEIKETEVLLGNWHDQRVLIRSLQKFIKHNNQLNVTQVSHIKKLVLQMDSQTDVLLEEAKSKIAVLFKSFA